MYELHLPKDRTDAIIEYMGTRPYKEVFKFMEDFKKNIVQTNLEEGREQKEEDAPPLRASN